MTELIQKEFSTAQAKFAQQGYELTLNHENQLLLKDHNRPQHQRTYETLHDALGFLQRLGVNAHEQQSL